MRTRKTLAFEIAVDANIALRWLLPEQIHHTQARRLVLNSAAGDFTLIAPPTFAAEADSAIRRGVHLKLISAEDGETLFTQLDALPITVISNNTIRHRAREIAKRLEQPRVYDATYAALAEARNCDFWTADKRFFNAANHTFPFVRFIGNYPL